MAKAVLPVVAVSLLIGVVGASTWAHAQADAPLPTNCAGLGVMLKAEIDRMRRLKSSVLTAMRLLAVDFMAPLRAQGVDLPVHAVRPLSLDLGNTLIDASYYRSCMRRCHPRPRCAMLLRLVYWLAFGLSCLAGEIYAGQRTSVRLISRMLERIEVNLGKDDFIKFLNEHAHE